MLEMSGNNEIASALLKSIDQDCMFEKYKKHKLLDSLTEEAIDIAGIGSKPIDPLIVFTNIAVTCSKKLDGLLVFLFDSLFAYSSLLDVFRDDEPVKQFLDELQCYNYYAVENKFLDAHLYPKLSYKLLNHTEEECEKIINDGKGLIKTTIEFSEELAVVDRFKCLSKEVASTAEKMFLKYILLVPAGLSDDQKKLERINFINDSHDFLEKLLLCNAADEESANNNEV